jgi:protein SEY1
MQSFEDRFRYDESGVPRIWRPTDDIDGAYSRARDHTLTLVPLLARFRLSATSSPPPLDAWLGARPAGLARGDAEDLEPIGGVDADADGSLDDETLVLTDARRADALLRFRKAADGVYVEAKRGALGGVRETPLWMWALLLLLGQNELVAVARSPLLLVLGLAVAVGLYVTYVLNLWAPIVRVAGAAWDTGLQVGKERLREFLVAGERGKEAVAMEARARGGPEREPEAIALDDLGRDGRRRTPGGGDWDDD